MKTRKLYDISENLLQWGQGYVCAAQGRGIVWEKVHFINHPGLMGAKLIEDLLIEAGYVKP